MYGETFYGRHTAQHQLQWSQSLYLFNPYMDLVDTLPDVRYWSEVLCCTILIHVSDLKVKVTDFEILS